MGRWEEWGVRVGLGSRRGPRLGFVVSVEGGGHLEDEVGRERGGTCLEPLEECDARGALGLA